MSMSKAKSVVRSVKNFTKGHSEIQVKVVEATSNEAGGPSGALMNEIARASFTHHNFIEIMEIIDKRLNDPGRLWRHVFKSLSLLEFLIYNGSSEVISHAKNNLHIVKTLREFQHIDDGGRDQGSAVRQKAKDLTDLLSDEAKLKEIRSNLQQSASNGYGHPNNPYGSSGYGTELYSSAPDRLGMGNSGRQIYSQYDEDREFQLAIEESKRMAQTGFQNPPPPPNNMQRTDSDADLQRALELSRQEAMQKENSVARQNELILLNDNTHTPPVNMNQYDFFGNPVGQHTNTTPSNPQVDLLGIDFSTPQQPVQPQSQMQQFSGLDYSSGNPFTMHTQPQQPIFPQQNTTPQSNGQFNNNIFGNQSSNPQSQFSNAFDGGFDAKPLPHQLANDANAQLAEIARNNARTDPFASLVQNRNKSPAISSHNPFNTVSSPSNQSQNNNFGLANIDFNNSPTNNNNAFQNNGYSTTNPKTNPFF